MYIRKQISRFLSRAERDKIVDILHWISASFHFSPRNMLFADGKAVILIVARGKVFHTLSQITSMKGYRLLLDNISGNFRKVINQLIFITLS